MALAALALLTPVAGGCGSSSAGEERDEGPPPSKADFIKTADAICEAADEAQKSAQRSVEKRSPKADSSTARQKQLILVVGLPPIQTEADELGELAVPEGDAKEIRAIVEGLDEAVDQAEADPSSMLEKRLPGPFAEVFRLAKAYGFKACSTPI